MNLWIRSQNKEMLIPNPRLSLEKIEENTYCIIDLCDDMVLGTYNLEEKALKVLDEIQERILDIYAINTILNIQDKNVIREIIKKYEGKSAGCVYEMPQE